MSMLIDSHCHLDFADFDVDRQQVIEDCEQLGIDKIVVPATQASSWMPLLELSQQYPVIKPALGLHPYFLQHFQASDLDLLTKLLSQNSHSIVAVGEIGLDYTIEFAAEQQLRILKQQLEIANDFNLPVILHHRRSHNDLIKILKQQRFKWGGIVHAFSGSLHEANTYIELGFKLGVGGVITYPRARKTREVMKQLPLETLVLETDAPDMPPMGKQGLRNSPQNLVLILNELSHLRQESPEKITAKSRFNVINTLKNMN